MAPYNPPAFCFPPALRGDKTKKRKREKLSYDAAIAVINRCDKEISAVSKVASEARELARMAGIMNIEATELLQAKAAMANVLIGININTNPTNTKQSYATNTTTAAAADTDNPATTTAAAVMGSFLSSTTAGHSNTDHLVLRTGDLITDRLAECKRDCLTRHRSQIPESRGVVRWDKPKVVGERRRRIVRDADSPLAPPEPPLSGFMLFVSHMTTKIRHDRPNERHDQTRVVQEISIMWRIALTDADRKYYSDFTEKARLEYKQQLMEFRATGSYKPSDTFEKVPGVNLWFRKRWEEKNAIEKEITSYKTYVFPPRPPEYDQAYEQRLRISNIRRKMKLRGFIDEQGNFLISMEEFMKQEEQRKAAKKAAKEGGTAGSGGGDDTDGGETDAEEDEEHEKYNDEDENIYDDDDDEKDDIGDHRAIKNETKVNVSSIDEKRSTDGTNDEDGEKEKKNAQQEQVEKDLSGTVVAHNFRLAAAKGTERTTANDNDEGNISPPSSVSSQLIIEKYQGSTGVTNVVAL